MDKDKIPKNFMLIPFAAILCCIGFPLLALLTAGTALSFVKANLCGIIILGLFTILLGGYLVYKGVNNRKR